MKVFEQMYVRYLAKLEKLLAESKEWSYKRVTFSEDVKYEMVRICGSVDYLLFAQIIGHEKYQELQDQIFDAYKSILRCFEEVA